MLLALLAQVAADTPAAAQAAVIAPEPWWKPLISPLFLTVIFIFLTTVITVLVKNRKKDKCLKLLNDYHVNYQTIAGKVIWGDLVVFSKGLEMIFDAPYRNSTGTYKTSAMIYEADLTNCLAICRTVDALTDREKTKRKRQINKCIHPSITRRCWRWFRNLFNTLNDAFSKAFSAVMGHMAKMKPGGAAGQALTTQKGGVEQIGQTLLGAVGNAYEPILERHIGKPVVLELAAPAAADTKSMELYGHLAEYSDKYIAVFNLEHPPIETLEIELTESTERPGVKFTLEPGHVNVTCDGPDVIVIKSVASEGEQFDLAVAMTHGTTLRLRRKADAPVTVKLERSRHVDIVVPRTHGAVHFGSDRQTDTARPTQWQGLAPQEDVEGTGGVTGSETETTHEEQAPTAT